MHDKETPKNSSKSSPKSNPPVNKDARNLGIKLMTVFTAAWFVHKWPEVNQEFKDFLKLEKEKTEQRESLDRKVQMIEGDAQLLDFYIKSAEDGNSNPSECNSANRLLKIGTHDYEGANKKREQLAIIHYITDGDNISYRHMTDKAYAKVTMKAGQLKDICASLFPVEPPSVAEIIPREWWDKPEISFNYDK